MATSKVRKSKKSNSEWHVMPSAPPKLTQNQWLSANVLGLILALMAALQLASYADYAANLQLLGLPSNSFLPALVVLAEIWAVACLIRVWESKLFRATSSFMLVTVTGFWFLMVAGAVSRNVVADNIGLFGRFANIGADWWAIIITAVLLGWGLYAAQLTKGNLNDLAKEVAGSKSVNKRKR